MNSLNCALCKNYLPETKIEINIDLFQASREEIEVRIYTFE